MDMNVSWNNFHIKPFKYWRIQIEVLSDEEEVKEINIYFDNSFEGSKK